MCLLCATADVSMKPSPSCCICGTLFMASPTTADQNARLILHRANKKRDAKYGRDRDWDHLDTGAGYGNDARFRYVL